MHHSGCVFAQHGRAKAQEANFICAEFGNLAANLRCFFQSTSVPVPSEVRVGHRALAMPAASSRPVAPPRSTPAAEHAASNRGRASLTVVRLCACHARQFCDTSEIALTTPGGHDPAFLAANLLSMCVKQSGSSCKASVNMNRGLFDENE
jgi:hypothetical protein